MARPKALESLIDGEFTDIPGQAEDITALADSLESQLRDAYSTLNADPNDQTIYYKVLKQMPGSKKPWECFQFNQMELDGIAERIRLDYGSGWYVINMILNGKLHKKFDYPILAPQKKKESESELAVVLQEMRNERQQFFAQMREMQTGGGAVANNPMGSLEQIIGVFVKMKELNPPPPPQNTLKDTIETLSALKDLMPDRGGGETNFMDILGKVIESPAIGHILQMGLIPKPGAQGQLPNQAAGTQGQPAQAARVVEGEIVENPMYVHYVALLVKQAQEGNDPRNYAGVIFENVGAPIRDEYLLQPDSIERAKKVNPGVALYEKWFMELQAELRTLVADSAS